MLKRASEKLFRGKFRRKPAALLADESGSATVETVLWLPMIFLVFGVAVDFSMVFYAKSQALRVVQDANRQASIGYLKTNAQVTTYIRDRLASLDPTVSAVTNLEDDLGTVTTTVTMKVAELEMLGLFRGFDAGDMRVSSEHMVEDWGS